MAEDLAAKEEERINRALTRKKQPVFTKPKAKGSASTSTSKPEWKVKEEERQKQEEERKKQNEGEERKRKESLELQRQQEEEQRRQKQAEELPPVDPDKKQEQLQRIKKEEEKLLERLARSTPGAAQYVEAQVARDLEKLNREEEEEKEKQKKKEELEEKKQQQLEKIKQSNPAVAVDTKLVMEILAEINKARASPKLYLKFLNRVQDSLQGNTYTLSDPHGDVSRTTTEGLAGLKEAIDLFSKGQRLTVLRYMDGLAEGCYDFVQDQCPKGAVGARLSTGETLREQVEKYGKLTEPYEELRLYADTTTQDAVLQWILDDGNPQRPHRKILLNDSLGVCGISVGPHKGKGKLFVVALAGVYEDNK